MGLSVCHGIITQHDDKIYVESQKGKGTTSIVELPLIAGDQAMVEKEVLVEKRRPCRQKATEYILIVDDEPAICDF